MKEEMRLKPHILDRDRARELIAIVEEEVFTNNRGRIEFEKVSSLKE